MPARGDNNIDGLYGYDFWILPLVILVAKVLLASVANAESGCKFVLRFRKQSNGVINGGGAFKTQAEIFR